MGGGDRGVYSRLPVFVFNSRHSLPAGVRQDLDFGAFFWISFSVVNLRVI